MNKKKKIIISIISAVVVIGLIVGLIIFLNLKDENRLTIKEQKWIDQNRANVVSISIPNDLNVFGVAGEGVFFDFSNYLAEDLKLKVNNNTVAYTSQAEGYKFEVTKDYKQDGLLVYKDHFVLISKNAGLYTDNKNIINLGLGINSKDLEYVKSYYQATDDKFKQYSTYAEITAALGDGSLSYAIVPLNEYKAELLSNNINILNHISDLNIYYYFTLANNSPLDPILKKKFNKWMKLKFNKSFNEHNYKFFVDKLNINEASARELTSKVYKYGFVENRPYEILQSGEYGGITAQYLQNFSEFSGVEFTYKKYYKPVSLAEAAITGKIDLYYNYYNIITNYIDTGELKSIDYYVIADNSIDLTLSDIGGLKYQEVYVLENSYLYDYLKDIEGIKLVTYSKTSDLKNILKKKKIVVVDENIYNYYLININNNYSVRHKDTVDQFNYSFRYKNDKDVFYKLFNAYTKTIDPNTLVRKGLITYNKVDKKGKIFGTIAKYLLVVIFGCVVVFALYNRSNKKVRLNTKVKKQDRIKYIDLLTSLKNRNYFNEKLKIWNKNKIYPQACIVFDINKVKELNDTYGHEEGDMMIQAVANELIKSQLDNSEIMRTDGNEFLVYLVGYNEKQILNYIKKLIKNFKKLPHENGVAVGFSMILDDTKLVEDAFNEASIQMRENKELAEDLDDEE